MNYLVSRHQPLTTVLEGELEKRSPRKDLERGALFKHSVLVVVGLAAMVIGADWIVESAVLIAGHYHVSDLVIGITLLAVGTSLPEVATTVIAARRGQADLAIGNAIGSNVFNVLCVLGLTSTIRPLTVNPNAIKFDLNFMFLACFGCWLLMRFRPSISRRSGILMLLIYVVYVFFLVWGTNSV